MNTPVLNDNLRAATEALCNLLAKEDKVVASKAKIGLFFQNPEATKLFEEVNAYGEELRNKHLAGMPPTEEEISKFDALRENVIKNDAARGFLEARQTIDELLNTINHYLGMSIDLGRAPTPEEIEEARQRAVAAAVGGNYFRTDNLAVLHIVDFEIFRMPEVLKNFSVFVSYRYFHFYLLYSRFLTFSRLLTVHKMPALTKRACFPTLEQAWLCRRIQARCPRLLPARGA